MKKNIIIGLIFAIFLSPTSFAVGQTPLTIRDNSHSNTFQEAESLTYFVNSGLSDRCFIHIGDTLYSALDNTKAGEAIWWIPFYQNNDTIIIRAMDLALQPFTHDTVVWEIQHDLGRIVMYKATPKSWENRFPLVMHSGKANLTSSKTIKNQLVSKGTLLILFLCFLSVVEGLIGLWLLWKPYKKNKVKSTRTFKMRRARAQQYLDILRLLKAKDSCIALSQVKVLLDDSATLKKVQDNPEQLKQDPRFAKLNNLISKHSSSHNEALKTKQDLADLNQKMDELTNDPATILNDNRQQNTELYRIMQDLKSLGNSANTDTSALKSDSLKKAITLLLTNARNFSQFKQYEPYFRNMISAVKESFDRLQNNSETDNTRTLLLYLSQLYSISVTLCDIYDHDETYKKFDDKQIASHKANVKPFCQKVAHLNDFKSMEDKGRKFQYVGGKDEEALIAFLKKYAPLDFNLCGTYYQDYLNS